jgi:hypothetical protein
MAFTLIDDEPKAGKFTLVDEPEKAPMGAVERFGMGLADPIHGGAQLLTKILPSGVVNAGNRLNNWLADTTGMVARVPEGGVDQMVRERETAYKEQKPEGFDFARLGGNILSPVSIAAGGAGSLAGGAGLATRMAAGGATGAVMGASAPVTDGDFTDQKLKQIGLSGVAGGLTPALVAGASRLVSPKASISPDVQLLKTEGVRPSIGQTLGGVANRVEEKMQSIPIVGDAISAARGRAVNDLNKAAINRSVEPIGKKVEKIGTEGIKEAGDLLSQAYDDVLASVNMVKFDGKWKSDLTQLKFMASALPPNVKGTFKQAIKGRVESRISKAGSMTAETMKQVDSEIGSLARRYQGSSIASEQELGDALLQAQTLLRDQVSRVSPDAAQRIADINKGWANLVRIEGAANRAVNNDGVFSPGQLGMAVRAADKSTRKRAVARGTALMSDLAGAGNMLGSRVPNSGSTDRLLLGAGAIGAGAISPTIPLALGAGAAMYTPQVQSVLRYLATARPESAQAVAGLLNQASPVLGPAGGLLGMEILKQ